MSKDDEFAGNDAIPYAFCMPNSKKRKFAPVDSRPNIDELENRILNTWNMEKTFEKSLEQTKDKPLFTFYDGPPYATGKPHYGHVLQSAIKDAVLRYRTMRGYHVPRRVGWDTHGLPVEVLVEKELGLKTKREVEEYGIENFNKKCREVVFRYIDEFAATLKRLGRWADYENGYATLDRDYMESEWWVFKQLWEKNLVYKDFRSTPYCVRCATPLSNFETGMGYKDKWDQSVYVLLAVDDARSLLVWTTTPWTLPANVAVAVGDDIAYVGVEHEGREVILAEDRVATIFGEDKKVLHTYTAEDVKKLTYTPLYERSAQAPEGTYYTVVSGDFVTTEEGSGLVHMAPAFGTEDFALSKKIGFPILRTVDTNGDFYEDVPVWGGQHIWDANKKIIADLQERGVLLKKETLKHSYPHCWRCDEPLIYYALDAWFVRVSEMKDNLLAANEKINWIPEHIKHGRFAKGIESAPDWSVSRNRFWSVPIPVWECTECENRVCIGSIAELQEFTGASEKEIEDIHRPYVDDMNGKCSECGKKMQRIPEVLDVWFDSGSMPYSQWHYPFENENIITEGFPADFIGESIEMTRAWFYVTHVLGVAVMDGPAYKNVIGSGIIFGDDGNKLSKKLKNYPDIEPTLEQYGADTLRLFFLSSTLGEPYVFTEKELQQMYRSFTMTLWNVYSFYVGYANTHEEDVSATPSTEHVLDAWILARLHELQYEVTSLADAYRVDGATRKLHAFIDDLSNWYVRRSRVRFHANADVSERGKALSTLHFVLVEYTKLLAPFAPFVSEEIYKNLTGDDSVHLAELPDAKETSQDERSVLLQMQTARDIVSQGLAARAQAKIKVRQPLAKLSAVGIDALPKEVIMMIAEEVNVDEVVSQKEGVELDMEITPELQARGTAREIIRHGQVLRRSAGYALDDKIALLLVTDDEVLQGVIDTQKDDIAKALQASEVVTDLNVDEEKEISFGEGVLRIGVKK